MDLNGGMNITRHACQRFMERVFNKDEPSIDELRRTSHLLSQEIGATMLTNGRYPLPSFDGFVFVVYDGSIVTVRKR